MKVSATTMVTVYTTALSEAHAVRKFIREKDIYHTYDDAARDLKIFGDAHERIYSIDLPVSRYDVKTVK